MTRFRSDLAGVAAVEFGLIAPAMVLMLIIVFDLGVGFFQYVQVTSAVSAGAEFATLAGQYGTAPAPVATETKTVVVNAANTLLATANVTVTVNNGNSASDTCCLTGTTPGSPTWTCAASPPTCPDQSKPGVYLTITGSVPLMPVLTASALTGFHLQSTVIQRIK